jgi:hypothetical protein
MGGNLSHRKGHDQAPYKKVKCTLPNLQRMLDLNLRRCIFAPCNNRTQESKDTLFTWNTIMQNV